MTLLHYNCFAPHVTAFSTLRGDSCDAASPYSGFNINPYCGDNTGHIKDCRAELCKEMGIEDCRIVLPHQTHGTRVADVDTGTTLEGADAVMTSQKRLLVGVSTADCIPILLHDTRHDAVCAVHSGWRGTVGHIAAVALDAMRQAHDTKPQDVVAAIGPGIRLDAFEVGDEVYETFRDAGFDMSRTARHITGRWHIDLAAAIKADLSGVAAIHDCGLCTHTLHHRFFSARRLGINSGRIYTAIMIR